MIILSKSLVFCNFFAILYARYFYLKIYLCDPIMEVLMKIKSKIFSFLLVVCLCFTPFVLSGCFAGGGDPGDDGGDSDQGGGGIDISQYISGVKVSTIENADAINTEIVDKYTLLGNAILDSLQATYGTNGIDINVAGGGYTNDEEETQLIVYSETFKNSMGQDEWVWGNTPNKVFSTQHKNLFIQNMFEATLGLNISNSFSSASLSSYASKVDHKGLFYYEADAIAEYILKNIIGTAVVSEDNEKFHDVNNNGTFDYYYTITDPLYPSYLGIQNIIKDFENTNARAEASTKSTVWNSINFGQADFTNEPSIGLLPAYNDKGQLHISYFIEGNYTFNGATHTGNRIQDYRYDQSEFLEAQLDDLTSTKYWDKRYYEDNEFILSIEDGRHGVIFSCFKNYVNNVYSIVYSAVEALDWDIESKATSSNGTINDYGLNMDESEDSFIVDYKNYKAATLWAKANSSIDGIGMAFELAPTITEAVTMDIYANYVRSVGGSQVKTKALLGEVTILPGVLNIEGTAGCMEMFDLTIAEPDAFSKSTAFYALGITKFDLTPASASVGDYAIRPSSTFIGSETVFNDEVNDYVEFTFVIKTPGYSDAKFKFAFMSMNIQ